MSSDAPAPGPEGETVLPFLRDAWLRVQDTFPGLEDLYLAPLDPSSGIGLSDRVSLTWQSARPWGEFFDLRKVSLPHSRDELRARIGHNMETYLYNYILLAAAHFFLFSMGHFWTIVALATWVGLVWLLFVKHEGDIDLGGRFTLERFGKTAIVVGSGLAVLFWARVLDLVLSLAIFLLLVVGIHSCACQVTDDASSAGVQA